MSLAHASETDAVMGPGLRGKYAIAGIGETAYSKASGTSTRALAVQAVRQAIQDSGLSAGDVDGMLSHSMGDSVAPQIVAADLGLRLNFHFDCVGGGASAEALVGIATGVIEAGMCRSVAIFRSMNGFSQVRTGGSGRKSVPISGDDIHTRAHGWASPAQVFAPAFMRHMYLYGTRPEQVAMVRVIHSEHAARNPKALYRRTVSVDEVLASRPIADPIRLLDCCVETDGATCLIVTDRQRARDCRHPVVLIQSVVGKICKPRSDMHFQHGEACTTAGAYAREILWRNAGFGPQDVDITAAYDAFTFTSLLLLEDYGFCAKGEGGAYVSDGRMRLGGRRPNNTGGGLLCEGYSNGMNLVIENVRQLRHDADDGCPIGPDGRRVHTFNYNASGCRQVVDAVTAANLGWGNPGMGSALVLRRE